MSLPPGNLHDNEWDKQKYEYINKHDIFRLRQTDNCLRIVFFKIKCFRVTADFIVVIYSILWSYLPK